MWVASWNKKYGSEISLDCTKTTDIGYYLNTSNDANGTSSHQVLSTKTAYIKSDKLYFPQKTTSGEAVAGGNAGYWLASPHMGGSNYLFGVNFDGYVTQDKNNDYLGLRLLVSLPSTITLTKDTSVTDSNVYVIS